MAASAKVRKKIVSLREMNQRLCLLSLLNLVNTVIIMNEFMAMEERIVSALKTVFDPEIPVNIYDLGLIYKVDAAEDGIVTIEMTLTAPNCPAADFIVEDVKMKVEAIDGVKRCDINLVFEPEWDRNMMSEEAQLELGML